MLPQLLLTDAATLQLSPLAALTAAAQRVGAASTASGIKRTVASVPALLCNKQAGLQGVIGSHLRELAQQRYLKAMASVTEAEKVRKRTFISGASKEAGAAVHVSRRNRQNRLLDAEFRLGCALRLGVDAFRAPTVAVTCPDCHKTIADLTAHGVACPSVEGQTGRTRLHTAMEVASRSLLRELDPQLVVTGSKDAYPADHGFTVSAAHPEAANHHADAFVYDTATNYGHLIDFTFTSAAKSTGVNGAVAGGQADLADADKEKQYTKEFPDLKPDSSPIAFVSLSMERNGSWSQGTRSYWKARVDNAHQNQVGTEFPTPKSVLTRRVLQTLAVALWRINAGHILQLHRRATAGVEPSA